MKKQCKWCGMQLELNNYHKRTKSRDGLDHVCKECRSIEFKARYENNKPYFNAKSRKWVEENHDAHLRNVHAYMARKKSKKGGHYGSKD